MLRSRRTESTVLGKKTSKGKPLLSSTRIHESKKEEPFPLESEEGIITSISAGKQDEKGPGVSFIQLKVPTYYCIVCFSQEFHT